MCMLKFKVDDAAAMLDDLANMEVNIPEKDVNTC